MILPDVNVLIGAFRPDAEKHILSSRWLDSIIDSSTPFGISPLTLAAVVRITSNVQVYYEPSPVADTARSADHILGQPHCRVIEPGPRHWDIFTKLCIDTNTTGRRTTDAWYAALAIEHDCEWITFDRGFGRYPGLNWRAPALP